MDVSFAAAIEWLGKNANENNANENNVVTPAKAGIQRLRKRKDEELDFGPR